MQNSTKKDNSIKAQIARLVNNLVRSVCLLVLIILISFIVYNIVYSSVIDNISIASNFSQSFKDDVDLKAYYYVIEGQESELPIEEVKEAKRIAGILAGSTNSYDGEKAIEIVLNLCSNLETCLNQLSIADGYDNKMNQLENNIYVNTELIQKYMDKYLFYEATRLAELREQMIWTVAVEIIITILLSGIIVFLTFKKAKILTDSITDPIDTMYERVKEISDGNLTKQDPVEAQDEKLRTLSVEIENMVDHINRLLKLSAQEQEKIREMELSLLQAQINPHFLYNTLDTIIWLIEIGKLEQAKEMVLTLSIFFRSFLSNGKDIITLEEERQHIESYLEIQQIRYKDILDYSVDIDDKISNCLVPKLTLQPLVENALYHGIKQKRGKGIITVLGFEKDGRVNLIVKDNGAGMPEEKIKEIMEEAGKKDVTNFGVATVYKRLCLKFKSECDFNIDSKPGEGTVVTMSFPYEEKTDE